MSSSTIVHNTARFPMQVGQGFTKSPGLVNDLGQTELEQVARILLKAGQRHVLDLLVQADGVTASTKGVIARVLDQSKRRLH